MVRVGVVGDYRHDNDTHATIASSIGHHVARQSVADVQWIATETIASEGTRVLDPYDGIWIAPGSPYRNIDGALAAITFARTSGVPLFGTCAGFQHIVLEYAREVLGFADAQHAEYDPDAPRLFITPLSCSLVGTTMTVQFAPGTRAASAYGTATALERYYCTFGLNPEHEGTLVAAGLTITGRDPDGEARVVELPGHPFLVGTLFVPQTSSTPDRPHPLIGAFVAASTARAAAVHG